ncbi:hypothetical protein ACFELO_13595 [Oceanicaulis sp. LC35]|uniref:hypothetical protein n=1 Tax=Oceanicaulis sp. LC35 TaxID=3349635 RepID=UPI003F84F6BE
MSADTPRPDAAEPVDAEFEPAPDSSGAGAKSKSKKSKLSKASKGGAPVLAFLGLTVLAASVGGGAGWLIGRYAPTGESSGMAQLESRIEALEAFGVTDEQLDVLQSRLEVVEEESAGAPLRTEAFEQLIRDVAELRADLEALDGAQGGSADGAAFASQLSALERRLETVADDVETALATAETTQSALQQMRNQPASTSGEAGGNLPANALTALRADITGLQADVRALQSGSGDLDALSARLAALEATVSGLDATGASTASPTASASLARQALAFSDLAQAAAHSQPFAMEYAMLAQVWPNRRQLDALIAPARTGAPTLDDLSDSFPAQSVREALGQTQRLWGVIEMRRTGDDQGVADQILTFIEQGELNAAIALAEGLEAEAGAAVEPWLVEARKREALDAALEDMRDTLARQADAAGER